jgi:hypothetical protein
MIVNLWNCDSVLTLSFQTSSDKVLQHLATIGWKLKVNLANSHFGLYLIFFFEWRHTYTELICKDPDRPDVDSVVVNFNTV